MQFDQLALPQTRCAGEFFKGRLLRVLLTVSALVCSTAISNAQSGSKIFRIGFVVLSSPATTDAWMKAFRGELRTLGYEDGRNLKIESRFAMAIVTC